MPRPETTQGARAVAGALAVAAVALFATLQRYADADAFSTQLRDPYQVMTQQDRLAPALTQVPPYSYIGLLTDLPINERLGLAGYYVTQYAVAPRVLVRHDVQPNPQWVVGYFSQRLDYIAEGRKYGLQVAQDLGGAVILYRREGR